MHAHVAVMYRYLRSTKCTLRTLGEAFRWLLLQYALRLYVKTVPILQLK